MKAEIVGSAHFTKQVRYDYMFLKDLVVLTDIELDNHDFQDEFGKVWLQTRGNNLIVKQGYAWDGASCAPDFKDVIVASGVHDALCQFAHVKPCFVMSKAEIDGVFRELMPKRFVFRWTYWAAVRAFGGVYASVMGRDSSGSCGLPHRP